MNPEYEKIFEERGNLYSAAMRQSPDSRRTEFEHLFNARKAKSGDVVVDIPAGGGYLKRYLPHDCAYHPLEITKGFGAKDVQVAGWNDDWPVPPAEHICSVAAFHHFNDHVKAITRLFDAAKPGGVIHIADVAEDSSISSFLDEFVGAHNKLGHAGNYLSSSPDKAPFPEKLFRCETLECPWVFSDREEMINFAKLLFGLSNVSDKIIFDALSEYVGVEEKKAKISLFWSLLYLDYQA